MIQRPKTRHLNNRSPATPPNSPIYYPSQLNQTIFPSPPAILQNTDQNTNPHLQHNNTFNQPQRNSPIENPPLIDNQQILPNLVPAHFSYATAQANNFVSSNDLLITNTQLLTAEKIVDLYNFIGTLYTPQEPIFSILPREFHDLICNNTTLVPNITDHWTNLLANILLKLHFPYHNPCFFQNVSQLKLILKFLFCYWKFPHKKDVLRFLIHQIQSLTALQLQPQ